MTRPEQLPTMEQGADRDAHEMSAEHLRFRVVTSESGLTALAPHWDALLERCAVRTPFMTWDWVSLWWAEHHKGARLCVAVVEDARGGAPLAIAPLMIGRQPGGPRKALRHLTFIGCIGDDASQGMDFLVPRGSEATLTPMLCRVFRDQVLHWDVIDLPCIHEESPNLPLLRTALGRFVSSGERNASEKSYLMDLPTTWEEQMQTWKSKTRVSFRTKWCKLLDENAGRALSGGRELSFDAAFEELWRLHAARFEGRHSDFLNPAMKRLQQEIIRRWAPAGRVAIPLLEADGKIIAAHYGFCMFGKYWSYQTGFDPAYAHLSAGRLSLGWTARRAIELGLREMDHMPGDARYKQEWSTRTRTVVYLEAFNYLSLTSMMFRTVRALNRLSPPVEPGPDAAAIHEQHSAPARSTIDAHSAVFIDVLRGLAALGVLITHGIDLGLAGAFGGDLQSAPAGWRWVGATIGHGSLLVWCFFVLSGLCIHDSIARAMAGGHLDWRRYAVARVTRIYPLFLLGLALACAVWWVALRPDGAHFAWPQFFSSLLSLQILTNTFPAFDPSWSLSNEMIYYFAWPLAFILLGGRAARAFQYSLGVSMLGAAGIFILWKVFHRFEQSTFVAGVWSLLVLYPLWLWGARLATKGGPSGVRMNRALWSLSIPLCLISEAVLAYAKFLNSPQWALDFAGITAIPGLAMLIGGAHHLHLASKEWLRPVARWLGLFSYPCYVLHLQLMILIERLVIPRLGGAFIHHPILHSAALIVPTTLCLALIGPWLENKTMRWRGGVLARQEARRL